MKNRNNFLISRSLKNSEMEPKIDFCNMLKLFQPGLGHFSTSIEQFLISHLELLHVDPQNVQLTIVNSSGRHAHGMTLQHLSNFHQIGKLLVGKLSHKGALVGNPLSKPLADQLVQRLPNRAQTGPKTGCQRVGRKPLPWAQILENSNNDVVVRKQIYLP